eukprot:SAG31_NODE_16457_length_708_cov_1.226601_2_plen_25_part_01
MGRTGQLCVELHLVSDIVRQPPLWP